MENPIDQTTLPERPAFHWVPGPNVRGTWDILIICLGTLIICVWSALHFDIPSQRHRMKDRLALGVMWIVIAMLCPEGLLVAAICQHIDASMLEIRAPLYIPPEEKAAQANPGWFTRVLKRYLREKSGDIECTKVHGNRKSTFGLVHAFYATMGGFVFDIKTSDGASDPLTRRYVPNSKAFLLIMDTFPEIIPDVSEESITDRAESSPMSKALLIVQVGWFCANCLSRLIQHLPLSLLEVSTAAHGFCTLLTYLVWWSKPQNIAEGIPFNGEPAKVQAAFNKLMQAENGQQLYFHSDFLSATPGASYTYLLPPRLYDGIPFIIAPIFYGLPHFLGWSKIFPTPLENLIWCISTCVVTASGCFLMSALMITPGPKQPNPNQSNPNQSGLKQSLTYGFIVLIISIVYVAVSGFLLGESLRQLFFLEPATYQLATWSSYWPHFF